MVPVPIPTFEKVPGPVPVPVPAPYLDHKKLILKKKIWNFFDFSISKLFYKGKFHKFQQIYGKMWMKKMFVEGNQIHNFKSSSGSDFFTSYGSGSASQKVTVPTVPVPVPVPQHWLPQKKVKTINNGEWPALSPVAEPQRSTTILSPT